MFFPLAIFGFSLNPFSYVPSFDDLLLRAADLLVTVANFIDRVLGPDLTIGGSQATIGDVLRLPATLIGGPIHSATTIFLIICDPFIDVGVMTRCFTTCLAAWAVALVIKLAIYVKGHFWSTSA